ncbi:MAG: PAS domain S-box protein [Chloroflexi bacterium]|nr:PAS domain S-box protein [Chloroflexota bacterium]
MEASTVITGQTRWYNSRIQPVYDSEGHITAALLIAYDITSQKEAEIALVEERGFVDAIMDTAEALIIGLDNEGHIMRFNWACEALTGYSFGEVAGRPFWDFLLLEEEKEEIKKVFHQMQAGDFPNTHENYWLTKSGERRAIAWANTCQLDTLGKVKYVIGTGIDITKQKQTEAELIQLNQTLEQRVADRTEEVVQSEKRFRAAFDLAAIGRVLATPEGQFFQVNQAFCEMTGYSEEELCQKTWWDITHPDFLASGHDYMQQLIQRTIPSYNEELTIAHKSGDTIWVRLNRILLFNADNQPLYLVSDIENITQRKTAEAEINRILAELERSNIELQQFAYVASHDLQEPLRMVTSYLQLLQRRYSGKLDSDADEFIGYAVDGANRMKQLIQDLLSFSRVGTRGKPFEPVEIKVILKEALTNLETSIQETAAQIDHDDLLPTITGDAGQLVQLFQNLLSNAIKFRGEAPPKIHIGVQKQESDWQFSIRDNGIGFDPQFSDRIFIIFQRLHTRANYGGTGIGLAICKKIVERHGGNIWVHSQPNAGTTFYFTIPANTIQKAEL